MPFDSCECLKIPLDAFGFLLIPLDSCDSLGFPIASQFTWSIQMQFDRQYSLLTLISLGQLAASGVIAGAGVWGMLLRFQTTV
jgi:hypothetical protein